MALVGFWKVDEKPYGVFSQWYGSPFLEDGITFPTAEHYMMYKKAMLFGDTGVALKILAATTPRQVKALGRKVANFSDAVWDQHRIAIVLQGNLLKFQQHPDLKAILLSTGDLPIAETSPYDKIWGTGSVSRDPKRWPADAQNLLGRVLVEVRKRLK